MVNRSKKRSRLNLEFDSFEAVRLEMARNLEDKSQHNDTPIDWADCSYLSLMPEEAKKEMGISVIASDSHPEFDVAGFVVEDPYGNEIPLSAKLIVGK